MAFYILCRHSPRCLPHIIIANPHGNSASDDTLIPIPILQMGKLRLREGKSHEQSKKPDPCRSLHGDQLPCRALLSVPGVTRHGKC